MNEVETHKRLEIETLLKKYVPMFQKVCNELEEAHNTVKNCRVCLLGSETDVMGYADSNPTYIELKQKYYTIRKMLNEMFNKHFEEYPIVLTDVDYEMMSEVRFVGLDDNEIENLLKPYSVKL